MRWLLAAVVLVISAHQLEPVRACSPAKIPEAVFPADGATDVPLDTLVFTGDRTGTTSTLKLASTGQIIDAEEVRFPRLSQTALRPRAPLPPNEEIVVNSRRFRTGSTASRGAGSWQLVSSREEVIPGGCGDSCGDRTTAHVQLRTSEAQPETVFLVTRAPLEGESGRVSTAIFVVPGSDVALRTLVVPPTASFGEQITLSPLASHGNPDPALALPVSFTEADGGCAVSRSRGRASLLPLVMLGFLVVALRVRPARRSPRRSK